MKLYRLQFGDFDASYTDYGKARIVLQPVPYDGTSTWMKGADKGPDALLDASYNLEFYDIPTGTEVYTKGISTVEPIVECASPEAMCSQVESRISQLFADGKFPVVLGGEHSVSIGAIRAAARVHPDLTVLQLDAHSDMRSEYHGSICNHACVMARAKEVAQVAQVGIRSSDRSEFDNIIPERIFYAHQIKQTPDWIDRVCACLGKHVYLTIDLDFFDPAYLPATGTPEPDGLAYADAVALVKRVCEQAQIVGMDIVELCPHPAHRASDFFAAKLLYQLLSVVFEKRV